MEIRVIDFGILTKHYSTYQNGILEINEERKSFIERLNPIRTEMESIIKISTTGLVIDNSTEQSRSERFKNLQDQAIEIDGNFQHRMKEMKDELNSLVYDELCVIITEWSEENSIDLVTGKMEVVFSNPKYESTNDILDILKKKGSFINQTEKI